MRRSMTTFQLDPDNPAEIAAYQALRRKMLRSAPWAFSATEDSDIALNGDGLVERLRQPFNRILAVPAVDGASALAGALGIVRLPAPKYDHRARLWGVFVDEQFRGRGIGRALMSSAIDLARSWSGVDYLDLSVSVGSSAALELYRRCGFEEWGREPDTLQWEGTRYDEIFMTLRL